MADDSPPHTPSKRYFYLPEILASDSWRYDGQFILAPIIVVPLFRTTSKQRADILARLSSSSPLKEESETASRELAIITWLRKCEPAIEEVVFDLVRGEEAFVSSTPYIFLSSQDVAEGSCVISHYVRVVEGEDAKNHYDGGYDQEFARVSIEDAVGLLENATKEKSWFPNVLEEERRLHISENRGPGRDEWVMIEKEDGIEKAGWKWPEHLPENLKMRKDQPTVISLIHLSSAEIQAMEAEMSNEGEQNVKILNWPSGIEPGSNTDLWNIFERIKPDWSEIAPYGELFGFFIDSLYLSGQYYEPQVIQLCRSRIAVEDRDPGPDQFRTENTMESVTVATSSANKRWKAAWNPTGKGWRNDVRDNHAIREVMDDSYMPQTRFLMANPKTSLVVCELPIFVLAPITPRQEHALRALVGSDTSAWQIMNIPGVGSVKNLVKWFQSLEYLRYNAMPPHDFVAVDALTLSALDDGKPSFLLGTGATVWHEQDNGNQLARDEVGYFVGRCNMNEYDSYDQWMNRCSMSMGLISYIEEANIEDNTGTVRYYWDCFDQEDKELNKLVSTRE